MRFLLLLLLTVLVTTTNAEREEGKRDDSSGHHLLHFEYDDHWKDAYKDKNTEEYKELASIIKQKIMAPGIQKLLDPVFSKRGNHVHVTIEAIGDVSGIVTKRSAMEKRLIVGPISSGATTEKELGEDCNAGECTITPNTECVGDFGAQKTCQCTSQYEEHEGACYLRKSLGQGCDVDAQCSDFQKCQTTCVCEEGSTNISATACAPERSFGGQCTSDAQCILDDPNMKCIDTTCQCNPGFNRDGGLTVCTDPTVPQTVTVSSEWDYYRETAPITPEKEQELQLKNLVLIPQHLRYIHFKTGDEVTLDQINVNSIEARGDQVWAVVEYTAHIAPEVKRKRRKRDLEDTKKNIRKAMKKLEKMDNEHSRKMKIDIR